jgi:hypothetical protein
LDKAKLQTCGVGCSQQAQQKSKSNKLPGSNWRDDFDLSIHQLGHSKVLQALVTPWPISRNISQGGQRILLKSNPFHFSWINVLSEYFHDR